MHQRKWKEKLENIFNWIKEIYQTAWDIAKVGLRGKFGVVYMKGSKSITYVPF